MLLGDLIIRIIIEGDKARAEVVRFESTVKKSAKTIEQANRRAGLSFKKIGDFAQRAYFIMQSSRMLLQPLGQMVTLFGQQEQAEKKVEQAVLSTGQAAGRSAAQLKEMATQLQGKTIFGDEEVLNNVTAQLLTFTNIAGEQFDRTQQAALDLATVLDGDLQSASIMLGKALNDPIANLGALGRAGIQFSSGQKNVIKQLTKTGHVAQAQTIILDELNKQYGGQAAAAAQTGAGALKQFNNALGDVKEKGGEVLQSFLLPLLQIFKPLLAFIAELNSGTIKMILTLITTIALLIKLPAILGGISAALKVVGISANIAAGPIGIVIGIIGVLAAVWASNLGGIQEKTKAAFGYIRSAFAAIGEFIKIIIERLVQRFKGFGKVIVGVFKGNMGMIKEGAKDVANSYVGGWDDSLKRIKGKFNTHLKGVKQAQNEQKKALSKPVVTPWKPAVDLAAAKKAEVLRQTLAAMRIANIANEYEKQKAVVGQWYAVEAKKYKGNAAILAELAIQKQHRLAKIEKDFAEKNSKAEAERAKEEAQRAEEFAKLKNDAMGDELAQRSAAVEAWFSEEQAKWAGNAEALLAIETIKAQKIADIEQAARNQKRQADEEMWQDFQQQRQTYLETASAGYDEFWGSLLDADMTGKQRREQIWEAMRAAFVSSIAKQIKIYIAAKVKEGVIEQAASAAKRTLLAKDSAVEAAHLSGSIAKNLAAMAARLFAGLAKMGPLGFLIGAAGVVGAIALVKNIVRGLRGFAQGGLIDKPELILAGEAGPEIIAPKKDFIQVMQQVRLQGAAAAGSGGSSMLLANRIDALEKSISKMKFTFEVDGRELAEANESGLRLLTKNDI